MASLIFNPLPNDKILDLSKLNAFADDKINVTQKLKSGLGRVENIVGKEENVGLAAMVILTMKPKKNSRFCYFEGGGGNVILSDSEDSRSVFFPKIILI